MPPKPKAPKPERTGHRTAVAPPQGTVNRLKARPRPVEPTDRPKD